MRSKPFIAFALLLFIAAAVHGLFLARALPHAVSASQSNYDARQYRELADNLLHYHAFGFQREERLVPDLSRTPTYPAFVALYGVGWHTLPKILISQHVLCLATALIAGLAVYRSSGSLPSALVACGISALDLTTMTYATYLLTETLFTFFLCAALYAWPLTDRHAIVRATLAGFLWGLATLTRPISLYLGPFVAAIAIIARLRGRGHSRLILNVVLAAIAGLLTMSPWFARNLRISGHIVFSTIAGENILYYRAAPATKPPNLTLDQWRRMLRQETDAQFDSTNPREVAARSQAQFRKALGLLLSHPGRAIVPFLVGIPRLYFAPNRSYLYRVLGIAAKPWNLDRTNIRETTSAVEGKEIPYLLVSVLYNLALVLLAVRGAVLGLRAADTLTPPVLCVALYLTLVSAGFETHARFRVPLVPFLAMLAARVFAGGRSRQAAS